MRTLPTPLRLTLAALPIWLALIVPNHPGAMTWGAFRMFPLELPALLLALAALPRGAAITTATRATLTALLVVSVLWRAADAATHMAFARGFNPLIDLHLIDAGLRLATGSIGALATAAAALGALAALALTAALLWWATGQWTGTAPPGLWRRTTASAAALSAMIAGAEIGQAMRLYTLPASPPGAAFATRHGIERVDLIRTTRASLAEFHAAAANDPLAGMPGLFARAHGADIVIVFVESYARPSIDLPLYADTHIPTLRAAEPALAAAGLGSLSGWLTSPISGGQSWLAHGTLATGLTIDGQGRYGAALTAPRDTIYELGRTAGYHTLAVAPAIVQGWAEAGQIGFDTVWDAAALDYRGQRFNWVTMPDQFTLAQIDRMRPALTDAPVLAQVALISSHAPWTPVARMIPWDQVGDGTAFDAMATEGPTPAEAWSTPDRVRDHYRRALDYSLQAVMDWAARPRARPTLLVVLGDHAPAPFVAMTDSRDVPVHLIGPPDLIASFADWGWTPGLVPATDAPVWPMAAFRDRFLTALAADDRAEVAP